MKELEVMKNNIDRFAPSISKGLTSEQVALRIKQKQTNKVLKTTTKTYWEIIKDNVFTFFNILLFIIAILQIYADNLEGIVFFIIIVLSNMIIGLYQDIRAKKLTEKLKIAVEPTIEVIRDGKKQTISTSDLVLDDVFVLQAGKQISVDGIIMSGKIEVDESIITGESLSIKKQENDEIHSGSFVISGKAIAIAERVGKNSFAQQIQAKAKQFKRPKSEILKSIKRIFRVIGTIIVPFAIILYFVNYTQLRGNPDAVEKAIVGTGAALIGMIPSGMFLFVSMTLAVGVIYLGRKKTMVQELYSIEMLARSDVICFDKTGTLTDGTMSVVDIVELQKGYDVDYILGNFVHATKDMNQSALAIKKYCKVHRGLKAKDVLSFSSEKKFSAVTFEKEGTYILGAYEFIKTRKSKKVREIIENYAKEGKRVLVLAHSDKSIENEDIPTQNKAIALVIIKDNIRPNANSTIEWFKGNNVAIKIISGDDPITVSSIARQCGVDGSDNFINLEGKTLEEVEKLALQYTIFGRVTPEQKAAIVDALKKEKHTVAMTGDGVNDIIAFKKADCSIAMASGADATKCSAHLVLMDSDFSHMPEVVKEGRRVVNNLQQTCSLYLTKTIFAFLLSFILLLCCLCLGPGNEFHYPFLTQHLYIWEFFGIGTASFFLSLQPNTRLIKGGFVQNVVSKALPGGIAIALAVLLFCFLKLFGVLQEDVATTMAVITMSVMCLVVLFRCCIPFNRYRAILFTVLASLSVISYVTLSILHIKDIITINIFKTYPEILSKNNFLFMIATIFVFSTIFVVIDMIMTRKRGEKND